MSTTNSSIGSLDARSIWSKGKTPSTTTSSTTSSAVFESWRTRSDGTPPLKFKPSQPPPPSNILWVGNLPSDATEEDVKRKFEGEPGYEQLVFRSSRISGQTCFVRFVDVTCATISLYRLASTPLRPTDTATIRLGYSKYPLSFRGMEFHRTELQRPSPQSIPEVDAIPYTKPVSESGIHSPSDPSWPPDDTYNQTAAKKTDSEDHETSPVAPGLSFDEYQVW
ncbi:hypothetical protein GQ53DRAFT_747499 [Thozetella sp. PMI_491]|nr:hypothetical protein GQ53DRAFT_747499 [Thozetella sp. PMI_491]